MSRGCFDSNQHYFAVGFTNPCSGGSTMVFDERRRCATLGTPSRPSPLLLSPPRYCKRFQSVAAIPCSWIWPCLCPAPLPRGTLAQMAQSGQHQKRVSCTCAQTNRPSPTNVSARWQYRTEALSGDGAQAAEPRRGPLQPPGGFYWRHRVCPGERPSHHEGDPPGAIRQRSSSGRRGQCTRAGHNPRPGQRA